MLKKYFIWCDVCFDFIRLKPDIELLTDFQMLKVVPEEDGGMERGFLAAGATLLSCILVLLIVALVYIKRKVGFLLLSLFIIFIFSLQFLNWNFLSLLNKMLRYLRDFM